MKMKKLSKKLFSRSLLIFLLATPLTAFAAFVVEEKQEIPSEFAQQGLQTLNITVSAINVFLSLFFLVSIIGLCVATVRFIIAGGNEEILNSAKKISLASVMGVVFSLIGYLLVNTIKYFVI